MDKLKVEEYECGELKLGIPSGIGPRILTLEHARCPGVNMFGVLPDEGFETRDGFWRIYGGHRLWAAPEADPRTYSLDDSPVKIEESEGGLRITGSVERENSVRKQLDIKPFGGGCEVVHRIKNSGRWRIRAACWALSVMAPGGFAALPAKPVGEGLLPDRRIILWPYTNLSDERVVFDGDYVFIMHDPQKARPLKLGTWANPPAAAYFSGGMAFVKRFDPGQGEYPDFGCSAEVYSCSGFLELETLGPFAFIDPGEEI